MDYHASLTENIPRLCYCAHIVECVVTVLISDEEDQVHYNRQIEEPDSPDQLVNLYVYYIIAIYHLHILYNCIVHAVYNTGE